MDADKLVEIVTKMRALGVTEYTEGATTIRLGPKPLEAPAKTKEQELSELEKQRRAHHEVQFAACHVIPRLSIVK